MVKICTFLAILTIFWMGCESSKVDKKLAQSTSNRELHRPQFHFTPPKSWMNDPNGMFFFEGEYHFFYQYYPDSTVWGPMHWAHAVSEDLVHWTNLPIALFPDSLGYIFSGSAVVDWKNTSGFGKNNQPPLVAMYTIHNMDYEKAKRNDVESQGIAFSNDKGRTWTKFSGNPVLKNLALQRDFRDPKLVWFEATNQWIVVLAVGDHAEFWGSPNLKNWTKLSEFGKNIGAHGGVWECPDLFPISVEKTGEKKWVWIQNLGSGAPNGGSGTQYFVGDFDGKKFTIDPIFLKNMPKNQGIWLDYGKDNYAGVTFSDIPQADGRRILIGWMSNWEYAQVVPTTTWRSGATLPRELILTNTSLGLRLLTRPARELESLRAKSFEISETEITGDVDLTQKIGFSPTQSELILEFEISDLKTQNFGVELFNSKNETVRIGFDAAKNQFFSDRMKSGDVRFSPKFAAGLHVAPRFSMEKTIKLHMFFDCASLEMFADDGATVMTELFFPSENFDQIKLFSNGGKVILKKGKVVEIKRIWN